MKKYSINTILVPLDYTIVAEKALYFAVELAKKCKAKLVLMNVVEIPSFSSPDGNYADLTYVMQERMRSSKEYLRELEIKIRNEHQIEVGYQSVQGLIYDNIIRTVHVIDADIIVMGTGGTSGISGAIIGSNAFRIVNNSPVPVLTVHEGISDYDINKIVFPVNDEKYTIEKAYEVIYFARIYGAKVILLGIISDPLRYYMVDENLLELVTFFKDHHVKTIVERVKGTDYVDEILNTCVHDPSTLVTIASKQDHGFKSMFHQKNDEKLVNKAVIPVLSVPLHY